MSTDVTRDNLYSPNQFPVVSDEIEIAASQTLPRGRLIGKQILDDEIIITPTGFTPASTPAAALDTVILAKVGTYTATCVAVISTTNGIFQLVDPDGIVVGLFYTGVAFNGGGLSFTMPAASDAYEVGDTYEFAVAVGDGYGYSLDTANGDGTNKIFGVLLRSSTTDVGETDICPVAKTGRFMSQALTAASGVTITDLIDALEEKNIYLDLSDADNDLIGG